jgi:hypothetical protein
MKSRFGEDFLDYVVKKIIIKGKHIIEPYVLYDWIENITEIIFLISFTLSFLIWVFFSIFYLLNPPIAWPVSLASITIFWVFVSVAFLHVMLLFSVVTGLFASGRRKNTDQ